MKEFDKSIVEIYQKTHVANKAIKELQYKFAHDVPIHLRFSSVVGNYVFICYVKLSEKGVIHLPFKYKNILVTISEE